MTAGSSPAVPVRGAWAPAQQNGEQVDAAGGLAAGAPRGGSSAAGAPGEGSSAVGLATRSPRALPAQRTRDERAADVRRLSRLCPADPDRARLRSDVVEAHLPLVRYLAARYRGRGDHEELVQVGTIGLIHAVDRFDPARGVELGTYAAPLVLGEIRRHLRDRCGTVRVPRRLLELATQVAAARDELSQRLRRSPTVAEVAAHLGRDEELVLEALEAARARVLAPLPPTGPAVPHAATDSVDDREALRPLLTRLSPRDREVLGLRLVAGLSQSDIAARLGISQVHVSRLLQRMVADLSSCLADAT